MIEIVCALITAVASVIVAKVGKNIKKSNEEAEQRAKASEQRAKLRERESLLSLRMIDATLQLSVVTANALTDGHNNGNVEKAREAAENAAKEYEEFMREITAHEVGR